MAVLTALTTAAPWVLIVVGGIAFSHAVSRILFLVEPAGIVAIMGIAGLVCLLIGVAFAVRNGFRGAPEA